MREKMSKVVASAVGVGVAFTVPIVAGFFFGETLIPFYWVVVIQGISGIVLSFVWPHMSWRTGLWLFAIWPLILLFAVVLGGLPNRKADLFDALTYLWILLAGCIGGWLGALISTRRTKRDYHPNDPSLQARP
jgi:hypothetical protein